MKKIVVATLITVIAMFISFSLAQDEVQRMAQVQKSIKKAPERGGEVCPPLSFVTTSPLPSTAVGSDYKCQLQVTGGKPPYHYMAPLYDKKGKVVALTAYDPKSGKPIPTDHDTGKPLTSWVPGGLPVDGLYLTPWGSIEGQPWRTGLKSDLSYFRIVVADSCNPPQRIEKDFYLKVDGAMGLLPRSRGGAKQ